MKIRASESLAVAGAAVLLASTAFGQGAAPAVSCQSLARLTLPDTTITLVEEYAAGELKAPPHSFGPPPEAPRGAQGGPGGQQQGQTGQGGQPGGPGGGHPLGAMGNSFGFSGTVPAFCHVAASLKPSTDSDIPIHVWLPVSGWNGKLVGNGANTRFMLRFGSLMRGHAIATANAGGPGQALLGHPEKVIDFGHRAIHLMTLRAKDIITAYYGTAPRHSYFLGNSAGGYQGLTEARRYPKDYDGIAIGWPPNPHALFNATQLWPNWNIAHNPAMLIPHEKYPMIHQAVLDACDALDGVKDGILTEPDHCSFQPRSLLCRGADAPGCLTAAQADFLEKVYQGPTNPRTGQVYFPGPARGEEAQELWSFANGTPRPVAFNLFKYLVFKDENWDWKTFNWDGDVERALAATTEVTTDANLVDFGRSGGKLLLYIGWENYHNPVELIGYYKRAVEAMGEANAARSFRLVTMPGTFQQDPPLFDALPVIEAWVEEGKAPDQILATYADEAGKVLRTRPVCAYPKVPTYRGTGDTDEAESFVCAESRHEQGR
jgi:feruloyl esterase